MALNALIATATILIIADASSLYFKLLPRIFNSSGFKPKLETSKTKATPKATPIIPTMKAPNNKILHSDKKMHFDSLFIRICAKTQGTANPEAIHAEIMNACEDGTLLHNGLSSTDEVLHESVVVTQVVPNSVEVHNCHKPKLIEFDSIFVDPL